MAPPNDLATASREELLAIIATQQAVMVAQQRLIAQLQRTVAQLQTTVAELEERVRHLEARPGKGTPTRMPGHKPEQTDPAQPKRPRKRRPHGFARRRATPTAQVEHAVEQCPTCRPQLVGGWGKRRREVIEVPIVPAESIEHVYLEREGPCCRTRCTPKPELDGVVVGQQRLGIGLVRLIVTLRQTGRMPNRMIQGWLETLSGRHLSLGAIVAAQHRVAALGQAAVEQIREELQTRPCVHADETGWRENGINRYVWVFCSLTERVFAFGRRTKEMVDPILGTAFAGVLASDFSAAYHHYPGLKQRCWAQLLRDIHDRKGRHPTNAKLQRWAARVHTIFKEATAFERADPVVRHRAQKGFERTLRRACTRYREDRAAPQRTLCQRIERHLPELFVFVGQPEVPADNNAAERSLRHLVTTRKISGGTRSAQGTQTKMPLSTLFGTWAARLLNPYQQCRQLLGSPRV